MQFNIEISILSESVGAISGEVDGFPIDQDFPVLEFESSDFSNYFFLESGIPQPTSLILFVVTLVTVIEIDVGDAKIPTFTSDILIQDPYSDGMSADIPGFVLDISGFVTITLSIDSLLIPEFDFSGSGGTRDPCIYVDGEIKLTGSIFIDIPGVGFIESIIDAAYLEASISCASLIHISMDAEFDDFLFSAESLLFDIFGSIGLMDLDATSDSFMEVRGGLNLFELDIDVYEGGFLEIDMGVPDIESFILHSFGIELSIPGITISMNFVDNPVIRVDLNIGPFLLEVEEPLIFGVSGTIPANTIEFGFNNGEFIDVSGSILTGTIQIEFHSFVVDSSLGFSKGLDHEEVGYFL
jgi:hypothetical protein